MSHQEIFEKLRGLQKSGSPEVALLAESVSIFVEQIARLNQEVQKLKGDVQQVKSAQASRRH